jgi:hypothetical protein
MLLICLQFMKKIQYFNCDTSNLAETIKAESYESQVSMTALKGHGNEADFLGFLQILGPHS